MNHHSNTKNALNKSVIGHIVFFCFAIAVLVGLYMYFHTVKSLMIGSVVLILGHVVIVTVIIYVIGRFFLRKIHAHPTPPVNLHKHLETEGLTINWAFFYDLLVKGILRGKEKSFREWIVDFAKIRPGEKVLDVGCGTGSLAIAAKLKSGDSTEIFGIDPAPEMIRRARIKAAKAGVNINFNPGVVEAIDFQDNTFDIVLSSFMVHHLPGDLKAKAFAEIYRVLKPGGRLLIVDFEPPKNRFVLFVLGLFLDKRMMKIDNGKIPILLEDSGFVSLKTGSTNLKLATYVWGEKAV